MKSYFLENPPELIGFKPGYHWAKESFGIEGDSIVGFVAPAAHVRFISEDKPNLSQRRHAHFISEHFDISSRELCLYQRLFADHIIKISGSKLTREGTQIYNMSRIKISKQFKLWRPISSLFYTRIALQLPPFEAMNLMQIKEWNMGVKVFSIEIMQAYTEDIKTLEEGITE